MTAPRSPELTADNWGKAERAVRRVASQIVADRVGTGLQVALRASDGCWHGIALGSSRDGDRLTERTRFPLASHTKTITTILLLGLLQDEGIDLDTPMRHFIPAFGENGKGKVTIRHLLTHTSGLLEDAASLAQLGISFDERFRNLCRLGIYPGWNPDTEACYSMRASFESVGYLVEFLSGTGYADFFDDTIGRHMGTAGFLTDLRGQPRLAAEAAAPWTVFTDMQTAETETASVLSGGFSEESLVELVRSGSPSAGAVGSARDVCGLWWNLGRAITGDSAHGVRPSVARAMVETRRGRRHDRVLGFDCDYGLGVMIGLEDYRAWGFPPDTTPGTFGHIGLAHVFAGFSPEWDAAFAIILNGRTVKSAEFAGLRRLFSAVAEFFSGARVVSRGQA